MLAILLELVLCLVVGATAAYFLTSSTNAFLIVMTAVACTLGLLIYLVRHGGWESVLSLFSWLS